MKTTSFHGLVSGTVIALGLAGSAHASEWAVLGKNGAQRATQAGCTVLRSHAAAGLSLVDCTDAQAQGLVAVQGLTVAPNALLPMIEPAEEGPALDAATPPFTGDDDFFFDFQWGHTAVRATDAWETGARGAGVRVAVLDSGIDGTHPDLIENINYDLAASFFPGQDVFDVALFDSHGTHVAGTIAAADNAFGTIGVAPEAEIVPVKVCDSYGPSCDLFAIWSGMLYAGDIGADIANMSLGGAIPRSGIIDENGRHILTRDVQAFVNIYSSVAAYAQRKGTTIIAAAGNESQDANHTADLMYLPAQLPGVVAVSALGPQGWIYDPFTNLDVPAFYTNSGSSLVTVSAPGGNLDFALVDDFFFDGTDACVGVYGVPCFVFDLVLSTDAGGWSWKAGTSMATPHAVGVAALIVGQNGGSMSPGALRAKLKATADDLGPQGSDAFFGNGRVNAFRAVTE